jgi:hypothetical protein
MIPQAKVSIVEYLNTYREQFGEDAWKAEVRRLALQGFAGGASHEAFWREVIKDYDWFAADELKAQVAANQSGTMHMDQILAETIKRTMPSCKTQAQFTTFRAAFDAFRATMDAIFQEDKGRSDETRRLLDLAFQAAEQATIISRQLSDVPEAATGAGSQEFKTPPAEFAEYDVQQRLLAELEGFQELADLQQWYTNSRERRDSIRTQTLRNVLMDAIRAKKLSLTRTL